MKRNSILLYIIGLLALAGCQQEEFDTKDTDFKKVHEGDVVDLGFSLITSDFDEVTTRMSTEDENRWDNVWVAQFDSNGDMVASSPQMYTNSAENLNVEAMTGENTFYFITNVDTDPFVNTQGNRITNVTELKDCIFKINSLDYFDTATKLPMVGVWKGPLIEDILKPGDATQLVLRKIVVFAKRLTSKINIIVEADLVNETFQRKQIYIEKLQLCAAPLQASYGEGSNVSSADLVGDFDEETFTSQGPSGTYASKTYYVLENMYGDAANEEGAKKKGNFAPKVDGKDLATYVKIRAFIDDGTSTGSVDYRVYLGKDAEKNFDIERNYHYTITIKIHGRGDITTDVRVASIADLYELQYRRPNNQPATNRYSETSKITAEDEYWGWTKPVTSASTDHLTVHTNDVDWTLASMTYTTAPANSSYVWDGLVMQYSAPGTDTWHDVVVDAPIPSDSRIRIKTGLNYTASVRTVTFQVKLHGVANSITREWKVEQAKSDSQFNMPNYSLFPGTEGVYSMAVRAAGPTMWRFTSKTSSLITFVGTVGAGGFKSDANEWQQGHGAILFSVTDRGNFTDSYAARDLGNVNVEFKGSEEETPTPFMARLFQLATAEKMLQTLDVPTRRRFAFNYSSHSLFTTVVGFQFNGGTANPTIHWALNMLDGPETNYRTDNKLVNVPSPVTGKENTLKIFNKMDRKAAEVLASVPANPGVVGTPIFTPAGICMSLNEDYWEIQTVDDPRFQWYLPSRNEALMDVMVSMLQLYNGGNGVNTTIWTSTTPTTASAVNAYFAGSSVDVSSNYSVTSAVRCIRKKTGADIPDLAYPYVKNVANTPVVVTREDGKGYVDRYRNTPSPIVPSTRYYHMGYPLRLSPPYGLAPDGDGPMGTRQWTLAPKFQVAKKDVNAGATAVWYVACGWGANEFPLVGNYTQEYTSLASSATGCESYTETDANGVTYSDWRLPTEMELRIMGLLGAGTSAAAKDKILQKGGVVFSDIPGFTRMSGRYWSGTEYQTATEVGTRANYVEILDLNTNNAPLAGTAINRNTNKYKMRCVRDIDR